MTDLHTNFTIDDISLINFIYCDDREKEFIRQWRNHDSIRKWMYQEHIITPEEHAGFIESLKADSKNFYWIVKDSDGEYIGVIYLMKVDRANKNAYYGIYSNPNSQKSGIGRILDKTSIDLAFKIAGLHTLKLEVIEDNRVVRNLHKKYGFSEEGRLVEFVLKDGVWKDVIIMGMKNPYES